MNRIGVNCCLDFIAGAFIGVTLTMTVMLRRLEYDTYNDIDLIPFCLQMSHRDKIAAELEQFRNESRSKQVRSYLVLVSNRSLNYSFLNNNAPYKNCSHLRLVNFSNL
jgi:hypothetical protein